MAPRAAPYATSRRAEAAAAGRHPAPPHHPQVLIARFKEREENVKMDIFATFNDLLQQVATVALVEASAADAMAVDGPSGTSALLQQEVPRVVKAISRQLKEKSAKTRVAAFHCLRQLVSTLPGCLAEHAAALVPGIDRALKDAASNTLRIEALQFVQLALSSHPPAVFQPHVRALQPPVIALVSDRCAPHARARPSLASEPPPRHSHPA